MIEQKLGAAEHAPVQVLDRLTLFGGARRGQLGQDFGLFGIRRIARQGGQVQPFQQLVVRRAFGQQAQ